METSRQDDESNFPFIARNYFGANHPETTAHTYISNVWVLRHLPEVPPYTHSGQPSQLRASYFTTNPRATIEAPIYPRWSRPGVRGPVPSGRRSLCNPVIVYQGLRQQKGYQRRIISNSMQRTSLRQLNKNKIAFDAATNSTTTATPSPSIAEQDRHHHYCDQLVDSVAMLAESPYTDASSATVCNSFDLRQHDMMERNQHEDERNAAVMSDSDTSSSTSAELPPGTLAMFEMGASLDDEDYTDESAGEGGLNDDEFARRRQQRSLFAIEKNTTDSNSISNSTISLETRRTDFLPAASPATKAAGPLTDTVAVASSAGTANNSQRKTTDDDFVDCTYDADNDNASQPPAGDGGNPAAALPTRSLRGRRPLSYNCLEGLGRGETRDGFGPTTGICHHRNRSDLGEIHQYHLSRGRTESDPQRISGATFLSFFYCICISLPPSPFTLPQPPPPPSLLPLPSRLPVYFNHSSKQGRGEECSQTGMCVRCVCVRMCVRAFPC